MKEIIVTKRAIIERGLKFQGMKMLTHSVKNQFRKEKRLTTRHCNFIAAQNLALLAPNTQRLLLYNDLISAFNPRNLLLKPVFKYGKITFSVG